MCCERIVCWSRPTRLTSGRLSRRLENNLASIPTRWPPCAAAVMSSACRASGERQPQAAAIRERRVPKATRLLAVDLGAESGRTVLGSFDGERLAVEKVKRFPNGPIEVGGVLQWDVLRLYADMLEGVRAAGSVASIGIDTWGVDFGLLDRAGHLLGNPVHYRDRRTDGMIEEATRRVPRDEIYAQTGVQFMPINTLYQLLALATSDDPQLRTADRLLMVPALLAYWLTGVQADEFTDATTTQCYDPVAGARAVDPVGRLEIPTPIFGGKG